MTLTDLQSAVIEQLGYDELDTECKETLEDIANHGVDGGFSGFIYYTDTVKFFDDNRELILRELHDMADSLGENAESVVQGFGCLRGNDWSDEIFSVIAGIDCDDDTTIKNALAWFAAEHVARELID